MIFTGLVISESLKNTAILLDRRITITKEETWNVGNRAVSWQPKVWTAVYLEGADKDIEAIAGAIADSIRDKWYANLSDSTTEYVIFSDKVFSYSKGDIDTKQKARDYAKLIGVPEHQLDW